MVSRVIPVLKVGDLLFSLQLAVSPPTTQHPSISEWDLNEGVVTSYDYKTPAPRGQEVSAPHVPEIVREPLHNLSYWGYLHSIIECSSGGYAATGMGVQNWYDILLARFGEQGNALWNRTYDIGRWESGRYLVELPDGAS